MSFIVILLKNIESVIYYNFCHYCFEAAKELHKVPFSIFIYISIGTFTIPATSKQQTPNSQAIAGSSDLGGLDLNVVLNCLIQVNYVNSIFYPVSVRNFSSPRRGILCIMIGDLTLKSALLLFTLVSENKPHLKNLPIIGNHIKCL